MKFCLLAQFNTDSFVLRRVPKKVYDIAHTLYYMYYTIQTYSCPFSYSCLFWL